MIKGLLFDLNGTVIDIYTSESDDQIYRTLSNFLDYYRVRISPQLLRDEYFSILKQQKKESSEDFPEFDVIKLFSELIGKYSTEESLSVAPETAAIVFRAAGRYKLEPYCGVIQTLETLAKEYQMSAVSDGQAVWALPELHSAGLDRLFTHTIVSSDYGFRKPDHRMYEMALQKMKLLPEDVIFVGNDMYRDIYGAHEFGMKTVFFRSNQGEQNFCGADADYIIYNFPELLKAVEFLKNRQ